jgi:hypothetical protein
VYGAIYNANTTATMNINSTPAKYTLFNTNGIANRVTVDAANDRLVIQVSGVYQVAFNGCVSEGTAGTVQFHLRKNGAEQAEFGVKVKLATTLGFTGFFGFGSFVAGDVLEVYVDGNNTTLTSFDSRLMINRIA